MYKSLNNNVRAVTLFFDQKNHYQNGHEINTFSHINFKVSLRCK